MASPAWGAPARSGADDVHGLWVDHDESDQQKVAVWIEDCGSLLCGRIFWLKKPMTASGRPKRDRHNPDAALRDRPLCGLRILSGFRRAKENTWAEGQIYNPDDGRTYSSTMTLGSDGALEVRGYLGISLIGKTVAWVRPREQTRSCSQPVPAKNTPG